MRFQGGEKRREISDEVLGERKGDFGANVAFDHGLIDVRFDESGGGDRVEKRRLDDD